LGLKLSKLECYTIALRMVWTGYTAKLNHLVLSVLDGIERNVPAFRVGVGYCSTGVVICCGMRPRLHRGKVPVGTVG
jgi:hypothetical protein